MEVVPTAEHFDVVIIGGGPGGYAAALYGAATWLALTAGRPVAAFLFGTLGGAAIAMLFVAGHDACHGSFTPHRRLNGWLGRAAFLPSLTPFRAWDEGHNRTHHVYTNLKPLDYIWTPFSRREFAALPRWRRALERCYRTPAGVALYYAVEVWWKRLFFARGIGATADSVLCSAWAMALTAAGWQFGWMSLLAGVVWPFLVWNWLMGWAIFEHHTHPRVPWFDRESEWRAAGAQARCTVHIVLPALFDLALHRIMQHTAHHLDITLPLYRLKGAQTTVERCAPAVIVYRWSPLTFIRHLRACQLYDFDAHQWLTFDGRPSAAPMLAAGRREFAGSSTSREA